MPPNTPPPSPTVSENVEEDVLEEEDVVEVIDLDNIEEVIEEDGRENEMSFDDDTEPTFTQENGASFQTKTVEVNSEVLFSQHKGSVFTCDISPNSLVPIAVSGGEDDRAFIWNWKTGEVVSELGSSNQNVMNFKDSVVFARFNKDGTLVAAADMSGVIKVWRIPKCFQDANNSLASPTVFQINIEPLWKFETSDISWLGWHRGAPNVLFAGTEDSELWMWKVPSGDSKVYMGRGEKVETAIIMPDGKRIAVAYGDGSIKMFDLKTGEVLNNFSHYDKNTISSESDTPSSGMPVASLDVRSEGGGQILASGGVNGIAKMYNTQTSKPIGTLVCAASNSRETEESDMPNKTTVEAVLFSNLDQNTIITGTLSGIVTIWDVSTQVSRHATNVGDGVVKIMYRKVAQQNPTQIFVATLDGVIRILDTRTGKVIGDCSGHTAGILDICQSLDGSILISSSDDGDCRVFDVEKVLNDKSVCMESSQ